MKRIVTLAATFSAALAIAPTSSWSSDTHAVGRDFDASAPPIFIAATSDDPLYSIGGTVDPYLNTYRAWHQAHIPAEIHMFATGGHGFGVTPQGTGSDRWPELFEHWLRETGVADKKVQR